MSAATREQLLEAEMRRVFFAALPSMDYEPKRNRHGVAGSWDEPAWAWSGHPWLKLLGITDEECLEFLQAGDEVREQITGMA